MSDRGICFSFRNTNCVFPSSMPSQKKSCAESILQIQLLTCSQNHLKYDGKSRHFLFPYSHLDSKHWFPFTINEHSLRSLPLIFFHMKPVLISVNNLLTQIIIHCEPRVHGAIQYLSLLFWTTTIFLFFPLFSISVCNVLLLFFSNFGLKYISKVWKLSSHNIMTKRPWGKRHWVPIQTEPDQWYSETWIRCLWSVGGSASYLSI